MSIILENQTVSAGVRFDASELSIEFQDDPSYIRSEIVLVDLMRCSIGIIFENAYHHIGEFPRDMVDLGIERMTRARLYGNGQDGRSIQLHAPVRFVGRTH